MIHPSARSNRRLQPAVSCMACLLALLSATVADAQTAYVANADTNAVTVLDTATNAVTATIAVGIAPREVAITRDATRAFVANTGSNSISVIDTASQSVTATVALPDSPNSLAVGPAGDRLYALGSSGVLHVVDTASNSVLASLPVGAGLGEIAVTPDGSRLFIASTNITVIDTATDAIVASCAPEQTAVPGVSNVAVGVAISPDGARAFVGVVSYSYDITGFRVDGSLAVVDTATTTVTRSIPLYSQPGPIAVTADGSRVYVGIKTYWANTLYGAGFLPGRWAAAIDTATDAVVQWIDLGADGATWAQQHTPAGLAVTPDRSGIYVSIPNGNSVAAIDAATNAIREFIAVAGGPAGVAVTPNAAAKPKPFVIDAVDDNPATPLPAQAGGRALASVLANDTLGGAAAAIGNVTLALVSASDRGITLAPDAAVWVSGDAAVGAHALTYEICEAVNPQNCDRATVTVSVRAPFAIHANADAGAGFAGSVAIANVLANDTLDVDVASLSSVSLSQVSADTGVSLSADGSIVIAPGVAAGARALVYRICELASPANCDVGNVVVTIAARAIHAQADAVNAPRTGGAAVANVLANDTLEGAPVTTATVVLATLSSTTASVSLDAATGAVSVVRGAPVGPQTLVYRICEAASPSNCSDAAITVNVAPYVLAAAADRARASSKMATTGVVNVLLNDTIGDMRATSANVTVSLEALSPLNRQIRLNADGTVDVLGKSSGGTFSLLYQICDVDTPANCARATLTLDLSGK